MSSRLRCVKNSRSEPEAASRSIAAKTRQVPANSGKFRRRTDRTSLYTRPCGGTSSGPPLDLRILLLGHIVCTDISAKSRQKKPIRKVWIWRPQRRFVARKRYFYVRVSAMLKKSCFSLTKTEGPSSDEFINEEVACENSGLRRSSISDTSFVRKIVKLFTNMSRGSGAY